MELLRGVAPLLVGGAGFDETQDQRLERVGSGSRQPVVRREARSLRHEGAVVGPNLFGGAQRTRERAGRLHGDVAVHELVPVSRDGPDERRLPRIVTEGTPQRADRLAERRVRHDDVRPYAIEDLLAMHGFVPALDQQPQQIEVAGDQTHLDAVLQQDAPGRREHERSEAVLNGGVGIQRDRHAADAI